MLISLCIVLGSFHATTAELSSCDRDNVARKAENTIWLFTEEVSCPSGLDSEPDGSETLLLRSITSP